MGSNQALKENLQAYKKKHYKSKFLKGSIFFSAILLAQFILWSSIEFAARLNQTGRGILFYSFLLSLFLLLYYFVIRPFLKFRNSDKHLSNKEAAIQIGKFFPEVSDKLLNIIQLEGLSDKSSELLVAGIRQKSKAISNIPFANAISLEENRNHLKWLYPSALFILIGTFIFPGLILESSGRILAYSKDFIPELPFQFEIDESGLVGFVGEEHDIKVYTNGSAIPTELYLNIGTKKVKAEKLEPGVFSYRINRLSENTEFNAEANGIVSSTYKIENLFRPNISLFSIGVKTPAYTGLEDISIQNTGNITVPEGSEITWNFDTRYTDSLSIYLNDLEQNGKVTKTSKNKFNSSIIADKNTSYKIDLYNSSGINRDELQFQINVIKDLYPKIKLDQFQDTVLYQKVVLAGQISDDYGFNGLDVFYSYDEGKTYQKESISVNQSLKDQNYYSELRLDSARIKAGVNVEYYVQVTDNDVVNGFKSSKTSNYIFKIPSKEEIESDIEKNNQKIQSDIDERLKEAQELSEKIKEADERLKTKKELEWQDEKLIQEILDQKERLSEKMEELKKENALNNNKQEQFNSQSPEIQQKMEQLQEIMENVLDDETKKLYDELRELLDQQSDIEELREKLDELNNESGNLEEDIERTLELFKKLQFDMKLEDNLKQLEEEIKDQDQLQKETEEESKSNEELSNEQKEEIEDLEKLKEEFEKLNELNQERKNPESLPKDLMEELNEAQEEQQKAADVLKENSEESSEGENQEQNENQSPQENSNSKASKSQQRAKQKMQQVQQSLQQMQNSMEMEQMQENLDNLRDLVDNLVTLSFNQESLMGEFRNIRPSDPKFVDLSQEQLKLKDDSQIIQDSLVSLSQRVFQISSFVMKELDEMNRQMDGTVDNLKEKRINEAVGKQQFTMTSINNLALLLDDVLQQMQNQMAQQMGMSKNSKGKGKNQPMPGGISELQKQLSEQISELKKSGKSGRQLSEQLAKLAAQQEQLRKALENFETGLSGGELGEQIEQLIDQMEQNELDLVNKNITEETVERQQDILTRLLDAENAMQERGEDDERKGNTAYNYDISVPESLSEYLKAKEKEIELLKTIPAKLNPYYKKEANKYFKRIKEQNRNSLD